MKLKFCSWNARGENDDEKWKIMKSLIKSQGVDLACLHETKLQVVSV